MTYGDGVSDVDLGRLVEFHRRTASLRRHRRAAAAPLRRTSSSTATRSPSSREAARCEGWINGGFFVLEPGMLDYIDGDETCGSASRSSGWPRTAS